MSVEGNKTTARRITEVVTILDIYEDTSEWDDSGLIPASNPPKHYLFYKITPFKSDDETDILIVNEKELLEGVISASYRIN